jgi:hypothetical protein
MSCKSPTTGNEISRVIHGIDAKILEENITTRFFKIFRDYINPKNIDFFERDIFVGKNV